MDPLNQTMPPAPASPVSPPEIGTPSPITPPVPNTPTPVGPPTPGGMSQEQMKASLQELMAKIEGKYQDFNSQKFSSDNKFKEQQSMALRDLFDFFQSLGVDLNDVEAVKAFLDKLKETNPELSQQMEQALTVLLGEDPVATTQPTQDQGTPAPEVGFPQQTGAASPDNMNINQNAAPQ